MNSAPEPAPSAPPRPCCARRHFLQAFGGASALLGLIGAGLLKPAAALAIDAPAPAFPRAAFEARTLAEALRLIDAAGAETSTEILLGAPEVAENGAAVPIEVLSRLPGTTRIAVLVEDNPFPLALQISFAAGAVPRVQARLKMAATSRLRVVASAGGRHYARFREVQVINGGCGDTGDSR